MEFGIFNLMGAREADKSSAQVFGEVAEQTRLADQLGYTIAWFAEHHFSNYCLCASPLMIAASRGNIVIVQALLAKGANPRKNDFTGRDALGWAAEGRRPAVVQALQRAQAKR